MKYGIVFLLLGLVCGFNAWMSGSLWSKVVLTNIALCFSGVGLGFLWIGPRVFLKRREGKLSVLSYLIFWPYHLLNWLSLVVIGRTSQENPVDEIVPCLYLGRYPTRFDTETGPSYEAVLDLTCEFPRSVAAGAALAYQCIPLLDTFAPSLEQLTEGVRFIQAHISHGPVLVHCAMGHGRSATFVAAYLVAAGIVPDAPAALQYVQAKRARIGLHAGQAGALEKFASCIPRASVEPQCSISR